MCSSVVPCSVAVWRAPMSYSLHCSVITYNTMISVYHRTGEWQKAQAMQKHMVQAGNPPPL